MTLDEMAEGGIQMRTPHTPPPWMIEGTRVLDSRGCIVAEVLRAADRPLIAAAPELLAAVKRAIQSLDAPHAGDCEYQHWEPQGHETEEETERKHCTCWVARVMHPLRDAITKAEISTPPDAKGGAS